VLERRPAVAGDEPFLRELYETTRPDLAGWEPAARAAFVDLQLQAQRREWKARYPGSTDELILSDGRPVGRIWVAWQAEACVLVDMILLPELRRSGIGTAIVREILAGAELRGLCVRVTVERTNAPSLSFCEKLGFELRSGDEVYVTLERPVSEARPPRASG
jgi:GNAT superfamily N-acetyltransferase